MKLNNKSYNMNVMFKFHTNLGITHQRISYDICHMDEQYDHRLRTL